MPGRRALQMLRVGCGWKNLQDVDNCEAAKRERGEAAVAASLREARASPTGRRLHCFFPEIVSENFPKLS